MDLLEQLLKGLGGAQAGQGGQGGNAAVLRGIFDMLAGGQRGQPGPGVPGPQPSSGLDDLIRGFRDKGLGDVIDSWVGTGNNRPIAPDQLERGLGQERVREMAGRSGLSLESLLPLLVTALPAIIDALTPRGQVPQPSALDEQLRSLRNRLG
jgi:uncharacterized protein YidB (DUF937 family)